MLSRVQRFVNLLLTDVPVGKLLGRVMTGKIHWRSVVRAVQDGLTARLSTVAEEDRHRAGHWSVRHVEGR